MTFGLNPAIEKDAEIDNLLVPASDNLLEAYPVSTRVNRVGVDDPSLIEPIEQEADEEEGLEEDPGPSQLNLL